MAFTMRTSLVGGVRFFAQKAWVSLAPCNATDSLGLKLNGLPYIK
jgi:hypothetical protein